MVFKKGMCQVLSSGHNNPMLQAWGKASGNVPKGKEHQGAGGQHLNMSHHQEGQWHPGLY